MDKRKLFTTALLLYSLSSVGQVEDVSVTIAPVAGYNWFDSKSTVENGAIYGIQAGFGFGKTIELRGVYERSADLQQKFGHYESDIQNHFPDFNFASRTIDVQRVGGEVKANLSSGSFAPYLILGTGVQTFERELEADEHYKNENLYGIGGLGLKFNLGDRTTFNIEGRGIVYNMNPGSLLYNGEGNSEFDNWVGNQDRNTMYNWGLMAGLQFYLGGRNDGEMSDMERAYLRRFSGGLSETKVTLSPAGAYMHFNNNSPYRDSYFLGGILGVDLTDFIGLQGYYYQATKDEKISLDFDKLALYGADFVGKLNVPRGIVPYISVGGGYLHAQNGYAGNPEFPGTALADQKVNSSYFAKGGIGVEIPLSKYVQVFGVANILYSMNESEDISKLRHSDELVKHQMYNAGLRFNFGKRANTARYEDRHVEQQQQRDADHPLYDEQLQALESEMQTAYQNNDTEKVLEIMQEKEAIDSLQSVQTTTEAKYIRLTPAELESLIDKVLDGLEEDHSQSVDTRLEQVERLLETTPRTENNNVSDSIRTMAPTNLQPADVEILRKEIELLRQELDEQAKEINLLHNRRSSLQPDGSRPLATGDTTIRVAEKYRAVDDIRASHEKNKRVALQPYVGVNFGQAFAFNTGLRANYGFDNTALLFMPEAYVAWGDNVGFGASANGVFPFRKDETWSPYAGLGVGVHKLGDDLTLHPNVIVGTTYDIGFGSMTADYTVRGLFKNNQLALGYRFNF